MINWCFYFRCSLAAQMHCDWLVQTARSEQIVLIACNHFPFKLLPVQEYPRTNPRYSTYLIIFLINHRWLHVKTLASNDILFWGFWLTSHHSSTHRVPWRLLYCVCFRLSSPTASVESASCRIFGRCSQACPRTGKRQQWTEQGSALSQLHVFPWGGQENRQRTGNKQTKASAPVFLSWHAGEP